MRPEGYIEGLGRDHPYPQRSHLYQGEYNNIQGPMCRYGANRDGGDSFSIWRGNKGRKGLCKICLKRALEGKNHIWTEELRDHILVEAMSMLLDIREDKMVSGLPCEEIDELMNKYESMKGTVSNERSKENL